MYNHLQTRTKYLTAGKNMKAFEDLKYEQWKENVENTLPGLLKRNLLVKRSFQASAQTPTQQVANSASAIGDREEEKSSMLDVQGKVLLWN